ncbi:hypothetical protein [Gordonia sp. NB41Y]|uniref:hypothetical protein n=1 Tax=Gordonia sp. NB41Y TaxID=875808 RepID=UPI0002BE3C0B|nr:hypothetical protein [Gordonia sp. NB41Y]EMP15071.1 hypothetical protein ISGA_25 [Gordonia sp. NB41Y]WLP91322.1 hypothetical protein Q9K23_03360 [Gordonia sp. NB41Y]
MISFPEDWAIRPPRPTITDPSTGNPIPGPRPDPIAVKASLEERFPRPDQRQVGTAIVDEAWLLVEPAAETKVPGGITKDHKVIGPDGTVWSIVRLPRPRRRRRVGAPTRYIALVIRTATDIKEK